MSNASSSTGMGAIFLGLLLLCHAGFSHSHYQSLVVARYGAGAPLSTPLDVSVEVLAALGLMLVGGLVHVGEFSPLHRLGGVEAADAMHKMFAARASFVKVVAGNKE